MCYIDHDRGCTSSKLAICGYIHYKTNSVSVIFIQQNGYGLKNISYKKINNILSVLKVCASVICSGVYVQEVYMSPG